MKLPTPTGFVHLMDDGPRTAREIVQIEKGQRAEILMFLRTFGDLDTFELALVVGTSTQSLRKQLVALEQLNAIGIVGRRPSTTTPINVWRALDKVSYRAEDVTG